MQPTTQPRPAPQTLPAGYGLSSAQGTAFAPPVTQATGPLPSLAHARLQMLCGMLATAALLGLVTAAVCEDLVMLGVFFLLALVAYLASWVLRAMWYYQVWTWIPETARPASFWAKSAPQFAAAGHFIPYFNGYWLVALPLATCHAVDLVALRSGVACEPAPRGLTLVSSILHFLGLIPICVWLDYRFAVRLTSIMERCQYAPAGSGGPGLTGL